MSSWKQFFYCDISRARTERERAARELLQNGFYAATAQETWTGQSCRLLSSYDLIIHPIIYASARALRSDQCKPITFGGLGPLQPGPSKRPHVRAVWACPATELQARVMACSGATVESCNVMAQCPAPGGRYTYRRRRLGAFGEARRAAPL